MSRRYDYYNGPMTEREFIESDSDQWGPNATVIGFRNQVVDVCSDCGREGVIHPDSDAQRGEPICLLCARKGAFDP